MVIDLDATAQGHQPASGPGLHLQLALYLCLLEAQHDKMQCNLMQSSSQRLAKVISELLGWVVLGTASLTADSPAACLWLSQ